MELAFTSYRNEKFSAINRAFNYEVTKEIFIFNYC